MEKILNEKIEIILSLINSKILQLISENYNNGTFNVWLSESDWDFKYIYEMSFKQYLLPYFTVETEQVLSYYSQNFCYALQAFYEIYQHINESFLYTFIKLQFKTIDHDQLFLSEN